MVLAPHAVLESLTGQTLLAARDLCARRKSVRGMLCRMAKSACGHKPKRGGDSRWGGDPKVVMKLENSPE